MSTACPAVSASSPPFGASSLSPGEITAMLGAVARDPATADELLPLVYDELRRHARARLAREPAGQTLQPTALVHEAWLRLFDGGDHAWQNRAHFYGAA